MTALDFRNCLSVALVIAGGTVRSWPPAIVLSRRQHSVAASWARWLDENLTGKAIAIRNEVVHAGIPSPAVAKEQL